MPEPFWIKNSTGTTPASAEVDRLVGLYESTQTPRRENSVRLDPPRTHSEIDRLVALAKRNDRSDSRERRG